MGAITVKYPVLLVNFKTYENATWPKSRHLAECIMAARQKTGANIIASPQLFDLNPLSQSIPTFAQHIDPITYGSNTGYALPEAAKAAGATGTLINHSEHKLAFSKIKKTMEAAKRAGLLVCICAPNTKEAKKIAKLKPDMIAVEPPELIGSGISVSKAKPEIISDSVKAIKAISPETHVLCGAGVSTGEDVRKAIELGAEGCLVASAIVNSEDPETIILEMAGNLEAKK